MNFCTLISSLFLLASLAMAQFSPACQFSQGFRKGYKANCGCCVVWSYAQNACVEARKPKHFGTYETCHPLFSPPIGSAVGPKGCDIWEMWKSKCAEWLDGHEDGFTQPDSGPDVFQQSLASIYGSTYAPTPTGPQLTVVGGSTQVMTSTSAVLVTSTVPAGPVSAAGEQGTSSARRVLVTITA